MNAAALTALAPFSALTVSALVLTLAIGLKRSHDLAALLAGASLLAGLLAITVALPTAPRAVTPLLQVDGLGLLFCGLFQLTALVSVHLSWRYLRDRPGEYEEYYLLLLLATLGAMAMAVATHFASFVLGLEILSIALYPLIAYPERGRKPLEASLKYLVLSGVASTMLLFGMALVYTELGTMTFSGIAERLPELEGSSAPLLTIGTLMIVAGVAFKLSLVPFHMWTPDVYQGAPAPVAAYVATVGKGAVIALVLRFTLETDVFAYAPVFTVACVVAGLSMIVGNLLALRQPNVKRVLAYSSIAHVGYLLVALLALDGIGDAGIGAEAVVVYLIAYFVMTFGAFATIGLLSATASSRAAFDAAAEDSAADFDADTIAHYTGLFWRHPWAATVFTAMLLSLAGIPLTAGFVAKFYVVAAGVEGALWALLWTLVIGSGIGLFYYLRIIYAMTCTPDGETLETGPLAVDGQWLLGALLLALLIVGVFPTPLIELVRTSLMP